MRIGTLTIALTCLLAGNATAQKKWNLRSIVDYAMVNNINVKLSDIQARNAALTYKQSKLAQYPTVSFSGNTGVNSGSNQDPTNFSRITQTYLSSGFQLQTSAEIFNFYSKKNTITANSWESEASRANTDKIKNDIALTAANAYLQILLSIEQQKITEVKIQQTQAQLINTLKLVKAGSLPELNATQLEAQLSLDSVNYISAKGAVVQNILTLKSYMNIDAAADFEIDTPPVESIPVEPIAELLPETVFALALRNQPLQHYDDLKLRAAAKFRDAAKGYLYPTFSLYGSLGSNYIAANSPNYIPVVNGFQPSGSVVTVAGVPYQVYAPNVSLKKSGTRRSDAFGNQLSNNFRQSAGISVSVPIFNGGTLKTNYEKSKLNINSLELQKMQDDQKLKQDIFSAYTSALIALEKFNASAKTVALNEKTYNFAQKRFDVGILGTFDLITSQNNLFRSRLEYSLNRFDYIFKIKVLEFYKGLGLKL